MKTLKDILLNIDTIEIVGDINVSINELKIDSRNVNEKDVFVAIDGTLQNGHLYIETAIEKKASTIICSTLPNDLKNNIVYVLVKNTQEVLGFLATNFYNHPSKDIKLIGITGTNGKTTCATLLFQLFTKMGYECGLISTIENKIGNKIIAATHTTPNAIELQKLLAQMRDDGCEFVMMEVSSHAIHQHRIAGTKYDVGIFTNITHDHLDYHHTFEEYIKVKKSFFDGLNKSAFAISNVDDKRGAVMLQNTAAQKITVSLQQMADVKGKILENKLSGLLMQINHQDVHFKLVGAFNATNILLVFSAAKVLGFDELEILTTLSNLASAEGRFDCVYSKKENILCIVDYAHTPDALLNVLATINNVREGNETLTTIIGCGGDRDKTKRPLMAMAACEHSDKIIFTSDNPRSENPETILQEMEAGVPVHQVKKYIKITDRKEAIKMACMAAKKGDIILLAGKGHEKYQEINGEKMPFDDKKIICELFEIMEK
ncbi:MAG: UDP-N-acetylmuramoyl-L-alanyl-D-glutamate--2,6-diaminopimelate ligase [Chitinophagaceae bacterium]|nr:UDP-N-acetylmuramoyl-L-alanyl-D-glutamate--2,6-diaminopimelate ligase [Chitinophagaceae bacterium]